jgi:diguanylate cyclase (GGDEF)-like protein/PAS domain S-box-containing protein
VGWVNTSGDAESVATRLREALVVAAADAVIVVDRALYLRSMRGSVFAGHGYIPAEALDRCLAEVLPAAAWANLKPFYDRAVGGETLTIDWETLDRTSIYEITFAPIHDADQIIGAVAAARDVSEDRRIKRELQAASSMLEVMFESAPVGTFINRPGPDGELVIARCNPAFARLLGREPDQIVGRSSAEFLHPDDLSIREPEVRRLSERGEAFREARWVHRDGYEIWTQVSAAIANGPDGEQLHIIQCPDVTDRKQLEKRLRHVAEHDSLTGLLTRRRFEVELDRELRRALRYGRPAALLMIDLDGFKTVNDTQGHAAGDLVLVDTALALASTLRAHDVFARVGGDEFAVILPETNVADAKSIAGRLLSAASAAHSSIGASIGLTAVTNQPPVAAEQLIAQADRAMYEAKIAGGRQVHVHQSTEPISQT